MKPRNIPDDQEPVQKEKWQKPRSKKRDDDAAWKKSPARKRVALSTTASVNIAYMRSNTASELPDQQPRKTAMLIERGAITTNYDERTLQENMEPHLQAIPTHRPVSRVTEFSTLGSPLAVETPEHKSRLHRVRKYKGVQLFSNDPEQQPSPRQVPSALAKENDFFASPEFHAIQEVIDNCKLQEVMVTPALLAESRREHARHNNVRQVSQHQVMVKEGTSAKKGSATKYVEATHLFPAGVKCEWLHMIAHAVRGKDSQTTSNLVAGTAHSNTDMLYLESQFTALANANPQGFTLKVKANLIEGTHIAKSIEVTVETPDYSFTLDFDTTNSKKPHISGQSYLASLVNGLIKTSKEQQAPAPAAAAAMPSLLFFERPIVAAIKESDTVIASAAKLPSVLK